MSLLTKLTDPLTSEATLDGIGRLAEHGDKVPKWRSLVEGANALRLPGVTGNNGMVATDANLDVLGDMEVVSRVSGIVSGLRQDIINRFDGSNGYIFRYESTGMMVFFRNATAAVSSVAPTLDYWKATHRVSDGLVRFFESSDGTNWSQVGIDRSIAVTPISCTQPLYIGSFSGTANNLSGYIHKVIVKNGIDGPAVLDVDFSEALEYDKSFTATTGQTVTINQSGDPQAEIVRVKPATDPSQPAVASQGIYLAHAGTNYLHLPGVSGNEVTVPAAAATYPYTVYYTDGTTDTGSMVSDGTITILYNDIKFVGFQVERVNFTGGPDIDFSNAGHAAENFVCETGEVVAINSSGDNPAKVIGYPCVRVDGDDDFMVGEFSDDLTDGRFFAVFDVLGSGGSTTENYVFGSSNDPNWDWNFDGAFWGVNGLGEYQSGNSSGAISHGANSFFGRLLHEAKMDADGTYSVLNGDTQTDPTPQTFLLSDNYAIAGDSWTNAQNASLDLLYLGLFPASVTDYEASLITDYLKDRFGVAGLPSTLISLTASLGATAPEIDLVWVKAFNDASSYKVEYKESSLSTWLVSTDTETSTSYTVTGLISERSYDFRVSGINSVGTGGVSSIETIETGAEDLGDSIMLVEWTDTSSDEDGFRVEWSRFSDFYALDGMATVGAGVEEYTITEMSPNTLFYIRIYAYNGDGDSLVLSGSAFTSPEQVTSMVASLGTTIPDIDLTWVEPIGGADSYMVEYKLTADSDWTMVEAGIADLFYTVTGLAEETNYDFRVSAENIHGVGEASAVDTINTAPPKWFEDTSEMNLAGGWDYRDVEGASVVTLGTGSGAGMLYTATDVTGNGETWEQEYGSTSANNPHVYGTGADRYVNADQFPVSDNFRRLTSSGSLGNGNAYHVFGVIRCEDMLADSSDGSSTPGLSLWGGVRAGLVLPWNGGSTVGSKITSVVDGAGGQMMGANSYNPCNLWRAGEWTLVEWRNSAFDIAQEAWINGLKVAETDTIGGGDAHGSLKMGDTRAAKLKCLVVGLPDDVGNEFTAEHAAIVRAAIMADYGISVWNGTDKPAAIPPYDV